MSPRTGRPTNNPKVHRLEIRMSDYENESLEKIASKIGTSKTDILMRGLQLIELQQANSEFAELSNCLLISELHNHQPLSDSDIKQILNYIGYLQNRYKKE